MEAISLTHEISFWFFVGGGVLEVVAVVTAFLPN
jgi:hypothetical protein